MRKKDRDFAVRKLYEAAEKIQEVEGFDCIEIESDWVRCLFHRLFQNDAMSTPFTKMNYWFAEVGESNSDEKVRSRRILALLFCAHLVERNELPFKF
jgi:hypothetical protein